MVGTQQRAPLIHERLTLSWRYKQEQIQNNNKKAERNYHPWWFSFHSHVVLLRHHHIVHVISEGISLLKGTPHNNVMYANTVLAVTAGRASGLF